MEVVEVSNKYAPVWSYPFKIIVTKFAVDHSLGLITG